MLENMRTTLSRRSALKTLGAIGAAAVLPGLAPSAAAQMAFTDEDIFNFALNLESLEAEYYLRGTTGQVWRRRTPARTRAASAAAAWSRG
jgi:hypothetical protein